MKLPKSSLELVRVLPVLLSVMKAASDDGVIVNSAFGREIESVGCPTNCTWTQDKYQTSRLAIDCVSRIDRQSSLSKEIDAFLTDRVVDDLVELVITNTSLTALPRSVCHFVYLRNLNLNHNKLTSLPVDCFNRMKDLQAFDASFNQLVEIQQGVFDGLGQLQYVFLSNNAISAIGLNTFLGQPGLPSLRFINLSHNKLTELEPWPLILGQTTQIREIRLNKNLITHFTNQLKWSFRCGDKSLSNLTVDLADNNIKHAYDLVNGWNIMGQNRDVLCLFGTQPSTFHLDLNSDSFTCDCFDYDFYRAIHYLQHFEQYNDIFCREPSSLFGRRVVKIPLQEFVCEISSPSCPEGCQCVKRPFNKTYAVTCRNNDTLPLFLPDPSQPPHAKAKFVLEFGDSAVSVPVVEYRDYFINTTHLNLSGSGVRIVTDKAWRAFVKFKVNYIDLSNNQLTSLPKVLQSENLTFQEATQRLALHGNPFVCACEDRWMRDWLLSLGRALQQPGAVLCNHPASSEAVRGKNILQVTDDQFCYNSRRHLYLTLLKTVVPATLGSLLLVATAISLFYRHRVKAYASLNFHPFDVDECQGEDMTYDIFLSCAYQDSEVGRFIVDRLEGQRIGRDVTNAGYKVCYHERDFQPGTMITENIQRSIERSRRVVCLVTRHFLRSEYCIMEFCGAWSHHRRLNKRRLVIIKWPEVNISEMDVSQQHELMAVDEEQTTTFDVASVKLFLSTHTYIEYGSSNWWEQLMYSLPINSLPSVDGRTEDDLASDEDLLGDFGEQKAHDDDEDLLICPRI